MKEGGAKGENPRHFCSLSLPAWAASSPWLLHGPGSQETGLPGLWLPSQASRLGSGCTISLCLPPLQVQQRPAVANFRTSHHSVWLLGSSIICTTNSLFSNQSRFPFSSGTQTNVMTPYFSTPAPACAVVSASDRELSSVSQTRPAAPCLRSQPKHAAQG